MTVSRRQKPEFDIVPIKRLDIYNTVLIRIRSLIADNLRVGDQLPSERELAERLGVSRVSVRQVTKVLESMGIIETRVGSGTFVRDQSDVMVVEHMLATTRRDVEFLKNLVGLRTAIETQVFEEAADRWTPEDSLRTRAFLEQAGLEIIDQEDDEDGSLDLRFERMVAEIAGNALLSRFQRVVHEMWVRAWADLGMMPDQKRRLHQEHLDILSGIE